MTTRSQTCPMMSAVEFRVLFHGQWRDKGVRPESAALWQQERSHTMGLGTVQLGWKCDLFGVE